MIESVQTGLNEELSKTGSMPFLDIGEARQAALMTFEWLLKESLPKAQQSTIPPNLYDMLSYLIEKGERLGFSYDTGMEQGKIVFIIRSKERKNKIIPIFVELLLAHTFKRLGKFESEITHTDAGTIIAKIKIV